LLKSVGNYCTGKKGKETVTDVCASQRERWKLKDRKGQKGTERDRKGQRGTVRKSKRQRDK
jgi:hypothetical protein